MRHETEGNAVGIDLGFVTHLMENTLGKENILKVMLERIPKMHEENKKAFEIGYSMAAVNT